MSAPVFLRNNYSDMFGSSALPVLEEVFRTRFAQFPMQREKLFKTVSTDRDIWQSTELHDLQLFLEIAEGEDYTYDRQRQGANKTLNVKKYGLGFSISEEAVEDGKFEFIADATGRLAESGAESQEIQGMNIINNGFTTETTADGVALFSTAHLLPRGGTFRNRLSTDADLSVTSFEQMLVDFETQFVGDTGIYKKIMPRLIWCAPQNKRFAKELIASALKPDTSDNNMNSFQGEVDQVMSSVHFTDTDAWGLCASQNDAGLRIVRRKAMETKGAGDAEGFHNDSIYYKSRYREIVSAIHPYGIFGTTGA